MIEFNITSIPQDQYFSFLKTVIYPALKDDPFWHFFNESELGLLVRCSKTLFSSKLRNVLLDNKAVFTEKKWDKDQEIVEKYWDYMKKLFHLNSEFAMENSITSQDFWVFCDRLTHSLYNMVGLTANSWPFETETDVLAVMLIRRSIYTGMRLSYLQSRMQNGESTGEGNKS